MVRSPKRALNGGDRVLRCGSGGTGRRHGQGTRGECGRCRTCGGTSEGRAEIGDRFGRDIGTDPRLDRRGGGFRGRLVANHEGVGGDGGGRESYLKQVQNHWWRGE